MKVDNLTLKNDLEIVESMNPYFSTVFTSQEYRNFPSYADDVNSKLSIILCKTNEVSGPDHLNSNSIWTSGTLS